MAAKSTGYSVVFGLENQIDYFLYNTDIHLEKVGCMGDAFYLRGNVGRKRLRMFALLSCSVSLKL
jgi:hypothetical protein